MRGLAFRSIQEFTADARYSLRGLRGTPVFTIIAILSLALGIGANTAMFSILNAVLLRPLPYPSPEQLVMLGRTAFWNVEQWRELSRSFGDLAAYDPASATLTANGTAERISVIRTTPNLFGILGMKPLQGRLFSADDVEQHRRVAVFSHGFWQSHFGASPNVIGSIVDVDGIPCEVVGVLPQTSGSLFDGSIDVWQPHTMTPDWDNVRQARGGGYWFVLGRLRDRTTAGQAQAEMTALSATLDAQLPASQRNRGVTVVPLAREITGDRPRLALWLLSAAVMCVLLIATTNIASLSLARNAGREREIAIRTALGASRGRIVRQLLAESMLLAVIAGLLGVAIAHAGIRLVLFLNPGNLARLNEVRLDATVLGWTLATCVLTGVLVGLAPALTTRTRRFEASWQTRGTSSSATVTSIRRALIATEFALAVILLAGAGLLIRSLWSVESVKLGFSSERVLMLALSTTSLRNGGQRIDFYDRVLEQVRALPGIENAAIIGDIFVNSGPEQTVTVIGDTTASQTLRLRSDEASTGFFQTIGATLLNGRFFSSDDGRAGPPVAIINDAMARRLWHGSNPIGQRFKVGAPDSAAPPFIVVGVVADMRRQGLEAEPTAQMFEPLAQNPSRLSTLLVRTSNNDSLQLAGSIKSVVHDTDKSVPVYGVDTLENHLREFLQQRRFQTWLLTVFASVALFMAAIGIYGLIHQAVALRTREIGIRIAVGATSGAIFRMVIREGVQLCMIGVGIGLLGALWLSETASSLLFGISPSDPWTFVAVSLVLTAVAVTACSFPARRAVKVDPIITLRQE